VEAIALDTTFLIDLQNDRRGRANPSGATRFLGENRGLLLCLPAVACGEYLEGFDDPEGAEAMTLISRLRLLPVDAEVCREYARQARRLRGQGNLIGANDLWIACTALRHDLPVATRNREEFSRVSGLQVIPY